LKMVTIDTCLIRYNKRLRYSCPNHGSCSRSRTPFQCKHSHHYRQQSREVFDITAMKCSFLSLLLDGAARWCSRTTVHGLWAAATTFLFGRTLVIVATVVVVVVDFHLSRCRLVHWCGLRRRTTLFLFSWRCRHAWRRGLVDGLHRWQTLRRWRRRRVVCSLRRVIG
jgi:hypothetical protein